MSSIASLEIVDCDDVLLVVPHVVIDADRKSPIQPFCMERQAVYEILDHVYSHKYTDINSSPIFMLLSYFYWYAVFAVEVLSQS